MIKYSFLNDAQIGGSLLDSFNRYQKTSYVHYINKKGSLCTKANSFVDSWDKENLKGIVKYLKSCVQKGGDLLVATKNHKVIAFANIEAEIFGNSCNYIEMPFIHVSHDFRHKGIGTELFIKIAFRAQSRGAQKLYIASHPSIESQRFYKKMHCTPSKEINATIYNREPLDIQLEFNLMNINNYNK